MREQPGTEPELEKEVLKKRKGRRGRCKAGVLVHMNTEMGSSEEKKAAQGK